MPIVPTDQQETTPQPLPLPALSGTSTPMPAQLIGQGLTHLGAAMSQAQDQADRVRAEAGINQKLEQDAKRKLDPETGYLNQHGQAVLNRPSGLPLAEEVRQALQDSDQHIEASLGNDTQRRLFRQRAQQINQRTYQEALAHEAREFQAYQLSVHDGTIKHTMDDIARHYDDPERINENIQTLQAAVYDSARLTGQSASLTQMQAQSLLSRAHRTALLSALQDQHTDYAQAYLQHYAKQMTAEDILAVNGHLTKQTEALLAQQAVNQVMASTAPPTQADRAFEIALQAESAQQQFDTNGQPLTSPKGAVGIAQLMPQTAPEAAKLAGLPWDKQRYQTDAAYNQTLGRAYFEHLLQTFAGDLAKTYAAYNAGPEKVHAALKQAQAAGQPDWLALLPKETQAYVKRNLDAYEAGQGVMPVSLAERLRTLRGLLQPHPQALKQAEISLLHEVNLQRQDTKQRYDASLGRAFKALEENHGNYAALPTAIKAAIPPQYLDRVLNFARKLAKGEDTVTDLALYEKMVTDHVYLANLSDDEFYRLRDYFSRADFEYLARERAKWRNGLVSNTPGDINNQALNTVLDDRFKMLDLQPKGPKDSAHIQRRAAIRQFVRDALLEAQQQAGKRFNPAEIEHFIDELFMKSVHFRKTFLGIERGLTTHRLLSMTSSDIPDKVRKRLKADLKAQGVAKPTEGEILNQYWHFEAANSKHPT